MSVETRTESESRMLDGVLRRLREVGLPHAVSHVEVITHTPPPVRRYKPRK
jgi:hypothetical protein